MLQRTLDSECHCYLIAKYLSQLHNKQLYLQFHSSNFIGTANAEVMMMR